jgi:hypothetical protein
MAKQNRQVLFTMRVKPTLKAMVIIIVFPYLVRFDMNIASLVQAAGRA